jgi:hypothetical protein
MPTTHQTVESFSLCLASYSEMLQAAEPVRHIEAQLLQQLDKPVRLLRWAIVRTDGTAYWCEGAYLKESL